MHLAAAFVNNFRIAQNNQIIMDELHSTHISNKKHAKFDPLYVAILIH